MFFSTIDEQEVANHSFDLIFAFDEIVALGYRESVNLAQIRTFTEMDSHEEKVKKHYPQEIVITSISKCSSSL